LQAVFNIIQTQLSELKLLLNVDKTKVMLFSKAKKTPGTALDIVTAQVSLVKEMVDLNGIFYMDK